MASHYFFTVSNPKKGEFWRRKAAELGSAIAQYSEGNIMYYYAKTPAEKEEGLRWLKLSPAQGYDRAVNLLKRIEKGDGS